MAQLLIRNIAPEIVRRLKQRAKQHHRSLEGELKHILETAIFTMTIEEMKKLSQKWRKHLKSGSFSDSTSLLHKDRNH